MDVMHFRSEWPSTKMAALYARPSSGPQQSDGGQTHQSRSRLAGSQIVKAIEHPVNFQKQNTLLIEHGHTSLIHVVHNWTLTVFTLSIGYSTTH